jgi:hypothetical protein
MRHAIEEKLVEVVPSSSNGVHSHLKVLYGLRSTAKNCSQKDINALFIKYNFYDSDRMLKESLLMILNQKLLKTTK